ncbi:MAG: hypothetical protein K2R98_11030 [Gemmataceae bacterium]|nr:hypothetical protein [Gemmataceae bacterium]
MYDSIILDIFRSHHGSNVKAFGFARTEIEQVASKLKVQLPSNKGDLIYTYRFRKKLPLEITRTAPAGFEWIIRLAGRGKYRFVLTKINRIVPNAKLIEIKIPDATPEIIAKYAKGDEQALLAKVRYNRLIDVFLRVTAYSLQSHLRTTVPDVGQIETDELYVAVRNTGQQFIVPVQAKVGRDQLGIVQVEQDLALCQHAFPELTPKLVAVQFMKDEQSEVIVMFELVLQGDQLKIADEKHYRLVPGTSITKEDLEMMAQLSD